MSAAISAEVIEQVRARAAEEAEAILRTAVEASQHEAADLRELEQRIRDQVMKLGGSLLEQALALAGPGYQGARRPCPCGGRQKFVGYRAKRLITLLSALTLRRAYYHCARCGQGSVPLDHRWDVVGSGFSPALREAVAWLSAELPFERSATLLERLCRVSISKERVAHFAHGFGAEIEAFDDSGAGGEPLAAVARADAPDFYTELDGTTLPLRAGWREAKVAALFRATVGPENTPQRGATLYLARLTDAEHFGAHVDQVRARIPAASLRRTVRMGDGAPWIWNLAALQDPAAIQIVDWYHATEHLGAVAQAVFGEDSPRVKPWVEARESELYAGQVETVRESLQQLHPRRRAGREAVRTNLDYFHTHRERMRYDQFRAQGLFIGSGVVEGGACKHVVGARLKRAGMRWSAQGAQRVLNLRLCLLNQQWEDFHRWRQQRLREAA